VARSLWLKLAAAFGLVVVVGTTLVAVLVSRAATAQFTLYVSRGGQALAARIAPNLAAYYARAGSWTGVEAVLADPWTAQGQSTGGMGDHMGGGMDPGHGPMMNGGGAWAMLGSRAILAGADGVVVADTGTVLAGTTLDRTALAQATLVEVDGVRVGTLLIVPDTAPATPAGDFLNAVNRAALAAGAVTSLLALLVSGLVFFQIARPLRGLAAAAQRLAQGEMNARAPVHSRDEVGQVAVSFNQMAGQLERYAAERQNMIADIAHELRTPLAVIQSNLEAMLDGVLPASRAELISLHQEVVLLNRLIGDLRTLSLAEAGQLQLDCQPVRPEELLRVVAGRFAAAAAAKGTMLTAELGPELPVIQADEERLGQALANLIDNALRYTPADSHVTVGAQVSASFVEFSVSDNGPGIPPDDLPHVFDRFWRGDRSRNRATGGSGLGLAIVKQLVEAQGGQVRVEGCGAWSATANSGARFIITFGIDTGGH
jgi:two-component system OmpR family sensor kinase/two-component system sensor histidine kinase BaeS